MTMNDQAEGHGTVRPAHGRSRGRRHDLDAPPPNYVDHDAIDGRYP